MFSCLEHSKPQIRLIGCDDLSDLDLNLKWSGFVRIRTRYTFFKRRYLLVFHTGLIAIMRSRPTDVRRPLKWNITIRNCLTPYAHNGPIQVFNIESTSQVHLLRDDKIHLILRAKHVIVDSPFDNGLYDALILIPSKAQLLPAPQNTR